jgi:hypothetical protein
MRHFPHILGAYMTMYNAIAIHSAESGGFYTIHYSLYMGMTARFAPVMCLN